MFAGDSYDDPVDAFLQNEGIKGEGDSVDHDILNLATRNRIAQVAEDIANGDDSRYDTDQRYNAAAPADTPKCNLLVRDDLNKSLGDLAPPKYSANEWASRRDIGGFVKVTDGSVERGDVDAIYRQGKPGHVGIATENGVQTALAASRGGVLPTSIFWNNRTPTVWRWNGE